MIDVTPDAVPVLDESHTQPGLYMLTGLSGHGFGIGPAAGRVMADQMLGRFGPRSVPFSLRRDSRTVQKSFPAPIEPSPY